MLVTAGSVLVEVETDVVVTVLVLGNPYAPSRARLRADDQPSAYTSYELYW